MTVLTLCASRTAIPTREEALANYYSAERRAGACPLVANERMAEFAKRLDDLDREYERDLSVLRRLLHER